MSFDNTIKLVEKQRDILVDVIQWLDEKNFSNTEIRSKVDVVLNKSTQKEHSARSFNDIKILIEKSELPQTVKSNSIEIFRRLGKAEAKVHGTTINKVHFHEVGAIDSIVDIVGGSIGMNLLSADLIVSSAINTGEGMVKCKHGTLPIPAPATLELLKGIPCFSRGIKKERTTTVTNYFLGAFKEDLSFQNRYLRYINKN